MRTIASVAIAALATKKKSLHTEGWVEMYRDTYKAWFEMRRQRGSDTYNFCQWRDFVTVKIDDMILFYTHGSNKDKRDRNYWSESGNIRVSISVMCGLKKYPKWQVDICIAVVDHMIS